MRINTANRKRILLSLFAAGLLCIIMVVLTAYSAELKYDNNTLTKENRALQGEVDTLQVKIKSANNIEYIEKIATEKLGMVYPEEGDCVYLSGETEPGADFALSLRGKAYN